MFRRSLPLWCFVLSLFLVGTGYAQDKSGMWNAAKRVKLGLDKAFQTQQVPAGGGATMNPLSPPNTPDIQVFNPSQFWQSEDAISVNFSNANQLIVTTNGQIPGSNPVVEQPWAFSTDGGNTWPTGLQSENIPPGIVDCFGDPVGFFDRSGRAYYCTLGSPGGIYFVSTTDFGATWSARSNADNLSSSNDDKQHGAADYSGTFPNNVYAAWTDFGVGSAPVFFARSTNQGATWQPRVQLGIGSNRGQGVHIAIGPNGEVYVIWADYTTGTQEDGLGFAKSTDGGATFNTPAVAYPFTGIRTSNGGIPELNNVRATSFPYGDVDRSNGPRRGWIYTVHPELVSGQADIFMHRSTDGGATWSSGIQVNGPDVQTGKWQWMASIAVDPTSGGISVSYYSMDSTGSNFMTNRYVAYSADGGNTWDRFVVSDVRALWAVQGTPNTNTTYNGDYYEIAATNGKAWPVWTDRRLGAAGSNNRAYVQPIIYSEFFGWVRGTITNLSGGAPLSGVAVDFTDNINQQGSTSDGSGFYLAGAKVDTPGTTRSVTLRSRKFGFRDTLQTITLTRNDTLTRNFAMTPVPNGTLVVRTVRKDSSNIRCGISVLFNGGQVASGFTDSLTGLFSTVLPLGSYDVLVSSPPNYGDRRFNNVSIASGSNPLYVVVRLVVENSPTAMRDTLAVGQVHAKTLTLSNTTATDTIPFRLSDENTSARLQYRILTDQTPSVRRSRVQHRANNLPKGAIDPTPGETDSSGGPDAFGYRWIDSDSPGGPTFNWVDISTVGTQITSWNGSADDGYATIPFPLSFSLYGTPASGNLNVCTNGFLSFASTQTDYSNFGIPSTTAPLNGIFPFWDDLYLVTSGAVYYYNDVANSRFIVEYLNVPHFSSGGPYTFEVIFKPDGTILYQYLTLDMATANSQTVGIQNGDGTIGLQVVFDGTYLHDNLATLLYLPNASWLSESPAFGTIPPNTNANITVTFDATGLTQNTTYNGNIIMDLTHPKVSGSTRIPGSLLVRAATVPTISIFPTTLTFPSTIIGQNRRDSSTIRNVGNPTLTISSVTTTNSRFVATATSLSIAPGDSARLRVVYTPVVPAGTDTGRVIILSSDPNHPRVDVPLTGTSVGAPILAARVDSLVKGNLQGGTRDSILFYVRNAGTAAGNYQARAIMYPRSSPNGPALGPPVVIPLTVSQQKSAPPRPVPAGPSYGVAPDSRPLTKTELNEMSRVLAGENAFASNPNAPVTLFKFSLASPGTLVNVAPIIQTFAACFDQTQSFLYAIQQAPSQLVRIDTATGLSTVIGGNAVTDTWIALRIDRTTGTAYAASTNGSTSTLYTIDLSTGALTTVGTLTGVPVMIAMAIDGNGQMYGYDIDNGGVLNSKFYSINKATGATTLIGDMGFIGRFAQDMQFDPVSGILYAASYNFTFGGAQLRTIDVTTGTSTLIGNIGAGTGVQMDGFDIKGQSGPSTNWLSVAPTSGSIALNDSVRFTAGFDATSPGIYNLPGNYFGRVEFNTVGAAAPDTLRIPARMFVVPPVNPTLRTDVDSINIGNVEIGRTDSSKSVLVRNIGQGALNVTNITFTNGGFSANRTTFSLPSLDTTRIKVRFTASAPGGVRTARMNFVCNDPAAPGVGLRAVSVGVPHIVAVPDTFSFSLAIGPDTTRQNFRVKNTGTDTLHYQINESLSRTLTDESASIRRSRVQHPAMNLPKGAVDPTPGEVDSSGGPDAFGYRWIDSDSPGGPTFNWVDVSTVGTQITSWIGSADDGYATIPFPMTFSLYGTPASGNLNVCTNGFLSLASTLTLFTNSAIPSTAAPLDGIFPFWDDLYLVTSGAVYYYNDVANNRFIVEYLNVPHFSTGGPYTFEVILKPDGTILYQYLTLDMTTANSQTVGIQNGDGTIGLQVAFDAPYLHDNLAVLITSDLIPWMSTDKTSGNIAPGDSTTVQLRVHPASPLTQGDYVGYQKVTGNTPDVAPVGVHLHATGGGAPSILVTSPNGGEQWARNTSHPITWTQLNVDSVKIEFSTSGSSGPWTLITPAWPARVGLQKHPKFSAVPVAGGETDNPNGLYNWLIPANATPSNNCYVRVSWKSNTTVNDMSNSAFTILASPPADTTWTVQVSGTTTNLFSVHTVDNNVAWAGGGTGAGTTGIILRTTNAGQTWTTVANLTADVFTITALDANTAIAANWTAAYTKLIKTTNGGSTWRTVDSIGVANAFYDNVVMFDANNGYAQGDPVASNWVLKKTSDGGNTWVSVTPALPQVGTEAGWNNSMSWVGTSSWFGTNNSKIYRSSDGGLTWTPGATTFANSYSVAFSDANNGISGSDTGPVDKSTNGGAAWSLVPGNMTTSDFSVWANPGSQEYWCTSGSTVMYSSNFGTAWSASPKNGYTSTQQANDVNMVKIGNNLYGWMVGNTGTIVRFVRTVTGITEVPAPLPTVFALSQNYPNPFNPTTQIKYDLPEQATVVLNIYNVLGQEVATLANAEQSAGFYTVTWDGKNNFGNQVSSGVYFYRFEAKGNSGQNFATLKKMLFLK